VNFNQEKPCPPVSSRDLKIFLKERSFKYFKKGLKVDHIWAKMAIIMPKFGHFQQGNLQR